MLAILSTSIANAITYTSTQNGNWMNPTTWSPIGIPVPGDDAIINHTVTMDTSLAYTSGSIIVNSSGILQEDAFTRNIWLNGPNAVFDNQGTTTVSNLLLSQGTFTNSGTFNVEAVANYMLATNTSTGVFNGVDSLYNDGTLNNNGTINIMTFFNNSTMNNYGNIWGLTTVVDSMYNNGTFLNDAGAVLYADSCTNANTFTNNGIINFDQFTNWNGTFTNTNYMSFGDMTNTGTFTNQDSLIGGGSVTNTGTLDNQAGAYFDLAISFLNTDTVNFNATFTANGRFEIGDSFYNFDIINGTAPGSIQCADTSYNSGAMNGTFDFCDLTPSAGSPPIDINSGTVAGTITFCTVSAVAEAIEEKLQIYPNPTNGLINISTNENLIIEVYNMLGEQVFVTQQNQVDLTNYENGVYLFRIKDLEGSVLNQERIIKQ